MADDDAELFISNPDAIQPKPKRARKPGTRNTRKEPSDQFVFIVDSAAAITGLVCFTLGADIDYAPTKAELEAILVPLLRILDRRISILGKLGPDAEDAALALLGIIAYVSRLLQTTAAKRAIRQSLAGGGNPIGGYRTVNAPPVPFQAPRDNDHLTAVYQSILQATADTGRNDGAVGG